MFRKVLFVGFLLFMLVLSGFQSAGEDKYFQVIKSLDIFTTLFRELETFYVDDIATEELIEVGINAMLSSLDPYTSFIDEEDLEDYRTVTTGEYGGIGAIIGSKKGKPMILMPYEGYPAYKSGLKIADEILEVDGTQTKGLTIPEVSGLLKGKPSTQVKLKIQRDGRVLDFELTRKKIVVNNVAYSGMITGEVGYIKLTDFTTNAGDEVKNSLVDLKSKGAKSIILDLRGNPGGLLEEAINVANVFIPKNMKVVETKGKTKSANKIYRSLDYPTDTLIPMVVLVNSYSASAAEIVAGVMQDYDRAVLLGRKTFGKGLVQSTRPLGYNTQLKLTTAKYYIPSGRCIQEIDYSNSNDGRGNKIADSLKMAFKTKNQRTVYDGGGVMPDIQVEQSTPHHFVKTIVAKDLIFHYVNEMSENLEVRSARDFQLSDSAYFTFIAWADSNGFDYQFPEQQKLALIKKEALSLGILEHIQMEVDSLESIIVSEYDSLVESNEEIVSILLKEEIVSRSLFQRGLIEVSFEKDRDILKAVEILSTPNNYQHLLAGSE